MSMDKYVKAALGLMCALHMASGWAGSEGCNFEPAFECGADGCDKLKTSPVKWIGVSYRDTQYLRICFSDDASKCIESKATIRKTNEGDYIASAIVNNPRKYGNYPQKLMAGFAYSINAQSRGFIIPISGEVAMPIVLSSVTCMAAG